jgi:hypothetical protein
MKLVNHWLSNIDYYGGILFTKGLPVNLDNKVWMFGCSHVYGTGLEEGHCAVDKLSELLGEKVFNFGRPAVGPMYVEQHITLLLKKYTPKAVIIAWPSLLRWQTKEKLVPYPVLWAPFCLDVSSENNHCPHYGTKTLWPDSWKTYRNLVSSGKIVSINLEVINRVRQRLKNLKTVEFTFIKDDFLNLWAPDIQDQASDGQHLGPKTQQQVAKWIANEF